MDSLLTNTKLVYPTYVVGDLNMDLKSDLRRPLNDTMDWQM